MMHIIIGKYSDIDYIIAYLPQNTFTPFVAAWGYNTETKSWGQGHYFRTIDDAVDYVRYKRERRN